MSSWNFQGLALFCGAAALEVPHFNLFKRFTFGPCIGDGLISWFSMVQRLHVDQRLDPGDFPSYPATMFFFLYRVDGNYSDLLLVSVQKYLYDELSEGSPKGMIQECTGYP